MKTRNIIFSFVFLMSTGALFAETTNDFSENDNIKPVVVSDKKSSDVTGSHFTHSTTDVNVLIERFKEYANQNHELMIRLLDKHQLPLKSLTSKDESLVYLTAGQAKKLDAVLADFIVEQKRLSRKK